MTITSWQQMGEPRAPFDRCSPNLQLVAGELLARWGGQSLGCYNRRPIAGTSRWSSHAFGAAVDVGIGERHGGPGTTAAEALILPWLTDNYAHLGVQQIHAYWKTTNRMWRSDRGWYNGNPGAGQDWIHIETNSDWFLVEVPIADRFRGGPVSRIAGADRFGTAVEISRVGFPNGAATVYIANGRDPADALSAGPLIGTSAPLLLCERDRLPDVTAAEVRRLGASTVVVLGGPAAVSDLVVRQLEALVR